MMYAVRSTHCLLQSHMFVLQQRWTMHLFKILGINSVHSCNIALAYIGIIVKKAAIQLEFTRNMKIHMKSFAFIFIEDAKQGIPCINIRCLSDIFSSPISYSSDYYINNGRTNFPLETLISPTNEMLLKHRSILFIISDGNAISLCSFYLFLFSI